MATHPRDNEDDWVRDWSGTGPHFFTAIKYRIEQNKLAIQKSHAESQATQRMRAARGRDYQQILQEMQMTDHRKVALIPTTQTNPRQHQTDALDIADMETMLVPIVRVPQRVATTDEIPMAPKRTSPLTDLVDFYLDNGTWHYVNKTIDAAHLLESAIDGYTQHHNTAPAQALHISSVCMLLLVLAHKVTITAQDGKSGVYEDERGTFLVRSDVFVNVDTVVFE